jgi:hypothetical protein
MGWTRRALASCSRKPAWGCESTFMLSTKTVSTSHASTRFPSESALGPCMGLPCVSTALWRIWQSQSLVMRYDRPSHRLNAAMHAKHAARGGELAAAMNTDDPDSWTVQGAGNDVASLPVLVAGVLPPEPESFRNTRLRGRFPFKTMFKCERSRS